MTEIIDKRLSDGHYAVREVLRMVLFFRYPHREIVFPLADAIEMIISALPSNAFTLVDRESGDWREVDSRQLNAAIDKRFRKDKDQTSGTLVLSGVGNVADYHLDYRGYDTRGPLFSASASQLHFWVPSRPSQEDLDRMKSLFVQLVTSLPISFAYCDLGLEGKQVIKQQLAKRYAFLDITHPASVAKDIGDKAAGAYWVTAYSESLATHAGLTEHELRSSLSAQAQVAKLQGNVLLVALGAEPQQGAVEGDIREDDSDRRALARLLDTRGIHHVPMKVAYFDAEGVLTRKEAQQRWHRRFLSASIPVGIPRSDERFDE